MNLRSISRYIAAIGSTLAICAALTLPAQARIASAPAQYVFQGHSITVAHVIDQTGGMAVALDDAGLQQLLNLLGATVTYEPGQRYILITTGEPVVISFAVGDRHYDVGPVDEEASFAPFQLDGQVYLPLLDLLHALDLSPKNDGPVAVLQPQLAALDFNSNGESTKLVAHAGIPLDGTVLSESADTIVLRFAGVGSTLPPDRRLAGGPVSRIQVSSSGSAADPQTTVTLTLAPGTKHGALGTDDQRDLTMTFGASANTENVAQNGPTPAEIGEAAEPNVSPAAGPSASGSPAALATVSGVEMTNSEGNVVVTIAVNGSVTYDWHRLRPPDNRWWIDLHNARLAAPSDQLGSAPVLDARAHQESPDTVRVALTLDAFDDVAITTAQNAVTISVSSQLADADAARTGTGSLGEALAAAPAPSPQAPSDWKFNPRAGSSPAYVAANPRLIVIDPGHGGTDFGAIRDNVAEKTINLDISKRLRDILVARGWQVIMTHDTDRDVYGPNDTAQEELQARDNIANNNGARLLVSVHANSFINDGPHGATVYYYKPMDYALAQALDARIASEVGITNDGVVKDELYVVHHAKMPAALVETAFLSNPDDRALLTSPAWRQKMAEAIADGISDYAGSPPPAADANQ